MELQNILTPGSFKFSHPKFRDPCLIFVFVGNIMSKTIVIKTIVYTKINNDILHNLLSQRVKSILT